MQVIEPRYSADFLDSQAADNLLSVLMSQVSWQRESFRIFGRECLVPRYSAWFGDRGSSYSYTNLSHKGSGWPTYLLDVLHLVNDAANGQFNFVILNRYDHGQHHMGWHRDDEVGIDALIASLSLGAPRRFRIQRQGEDAQSYDLGHGSLLCFDGRDRHTLSKTKKAVDLRINLTFRKVAPDSRKESGKDT